MILESTLELIWLHSKRHATPKLSLLCAFYKMSVTLKSSLVWPGAIWRSGRGCQGGFGGEGQKGHSGGGGWRARAAAGAACCSGVFARSRSSLPRQGGGPNINSTAAMYPSLEQSSTSFYVHPHSTLTLIGSPQKEFCEHMKHLMLPCA